MVEEPQPAPQPDRTSRTTSRRGFLAGLGGVLLAAGVPGRARRAYGAAQAAAAGAGGALDLATATPATFLPHIGSRFRMDTRPVKRLGLQLVGVEMAPTSGAGPGRESFALHFDGPRVDTFRQETVPVRHAYLGAFDLFLVPIGRPGDVQRYEAVINHTLS